MLAQLLDAFFPPMCGICGKENKNFLCYECRNKLQKEFSFKKLKSKNKYFIEQYYFFKYQNLARKLILDMKFEKKPYIYKTIQYFLEKNKKCLENLKKYGIIIVVPLSRQRLHIRGFNQSQLIAQCISNILQIKIQKNILYKTKNILPQSTLNKEQRIENIKDVYKAQNIEFIKNKKILLIDDIYTTGSTLNECCKILVKKGINKQNIGVLTFAKD